MNKLIGRLKTDPNSSDYLELAQLQAEDGQDHDAEATLRAGIRRGVEVLEGRRQLSGLLLSSGRADAARRLLKQVLDDEPDDEQTAITIADTLHTEGRTAEAITVLRRASRRTETDALTERLEQLTAVTSSQHERGGDGGNTQTSTSSYSAVGPVTVVEKIARVTEPTIVIDPDASKSLKKPRESSPIDDEDGETREGPMPLTLINRLRHSEPRTPVGKKTQSVTEIQVKDVDGLTPSPTATRDGATIPTQLTGSERTGVSALRDSDEDEQTGSGRAVRRDAKGTEDPERNISVGPPTQPNPVFRAQGNDIGSKREPGIEESGPATQRMPRVQLGAEIDLAYDSSGLADLEEDSQAVVSKEAGEVDIPPSTPAELTGPFRDESGNLSNRTVRRQRELERPQRIPYGGADLVMGAPPSVDEQFDLSENETSEFSKPPEPLEREPSNPTNVFNEPGDGRRGSSRRASPPPLVKPPAKRRNNEREERREADTPRPPKPPLRRRQSSGDQDDRSLLRPPGGSRETARPQSTEPDGHQSKARLNTRPTAASSPESVDPDSSGIPKWVLLLGLVLAALFCILSIVSVFAYRKAVNSRIVELNQQRSVVQDGNYASRTSLVGALQTPGTAPGILEGSASKMIGLFTRPRLVQLEDAREALLARQLSELVVLYGDVTRFEEARAATESLSQHRANMDDAIIAVSLLRLYTGEADAALMAIDKLSSLGQAEANWLRALVAEASEDYAVALRYANLSVQTDATHPHAYPLYVSLKTYLEAPVDALDAYRRLVEKVKPEHISSQIDFERLRISTRKRAGEASDNLRKLLTGSRQELSPRQRALIYDGLGRHYLYEEQGEAARNAFVAATDASPGDARFVEPLMLLHMRQFRLGAAESLLVRLSTRARNELLPLRARIALMRGKPMVAIDLLEKAKKPSPEILFLQGMARLQKSDQDKIGPKEQRRVLREAEAYLGRSIAADENSAEAKALFHLSQVLLGRKVSSSLKALKSLRQEGGGDGSPLADHSLVFRAHARALLARKKYRAATNEYEVALRVDPSDYLAHWGLCRTYSLRLKTRDAIKSCRASIRNKAFKPARDYLADLAESYGDHGAVIAALEAPFSRNELDKRGLRQLIRARLSMGQLEAVKLVLKKEEALKGDANLSYSQGLYALKEERLVDAQRALARAAKSLPGDAAVQRDYGASLVRGDRSAEAVSVLRKTMQLDQSALTALALSEAYLNIGEWSKAKTAAQEARNRAAKTHAHPRVRANALAIAAQARILEGKRSSRRAAERSIRQALAIEPGLPAGLLARGLLLETGRRPLKALPVYERLTQVAPASAQGYFRLGRLLLRSRGSRSKGRTALKKASSLDPEGIWGTRALRLLSK